MLTPAHDIAMKPDVATFATVLACTALAAFALAGLAATHGALAPLAAL